MHQYLALVHIQEAKVHIGSPGPLLVHVTSQQLPTLCLLFCICVLNSQYH